MSLVAHKQYFIINGLFIDYGLILFAVRLSTIVKHLGFYISINY